MRTLTSLLGTTLLVSSIGACKWTEFDDLEKETWVSTTGKPNSDSTDYGVALQRGLKTSPSGGKLVALGATQSQYTQIEYAANGDSDVGDNVIKLLTRFNVGTLEAQPVLIADPATDDVALVANAGGQSLAVLTGTTDLVQHIVQGPEKADAAAYILAPSRLDMAVTHPSQPIVAAGDSVYGTFYMNAPNTQPKCQLLDETAMPMAIRAVAGASITQTTTDDLVVWGSVGTGSPVGKLLLYPGGVFNGQDPVGPCVGGTSAPLALSTPVDTGFAPGKGSQIIMIDKKYALLVGQKDGSADSMIALYDLTTMTGPNRVPTKIGQSIITPGLRAAAFLDTGTAKFVAAGYPTTAVDGVKAAGQVSVFPLDLTTGLDLTPAMTLHDAQPEGDQLYGRALAVTPFNGKPVLAVAADNEVFLYFRLETDQATLYGETRQ
ncbi:MAG: hypothetical protein JWP01_2140 [Myxococcales bacterium]|nr:hypothetical protein [Myxococcales bacterium]